MAKRFTDTTKWAKESFCDLSLKMKLVWIYLCDNCDHAGVWDTNLGLMSFQIGSKISLNEILEGLGDKVELRGNKILLTSFVDFQYGNLNPDNKVHLSVIKRLENLGPCKVLASPMQGPKDKDTDKEKDKDKVKDKELREKIEKIYSDEYPLKKGKEKGVERLLRDFKLDDVPLFEKAVIAFKADCVRNKTEPKYIKHFVTFVGEWRDWLDPDAGSSSVQQDQIKNMFSEINYGNEAS